jgi:Peptidase family M23
MKRNKTKTRKKKLRLRSKISLKDEPNKISNFVMDAGPGCYIVREDHRGVSLEWERVDPHDYSADEEVPDIALDPEEQTLSLCNIDPCWKVAYITVYETNCVGADGHPLVAGSTTDNQGQTNSCIAFIVLCTPYTFVHLCYLDTDQLLNVQIDSDVQEWKKHPSPDDYHPQTLLFPLQGGPYLCTQAENGYLTHFMSGNLHALDFQCPVGTPILAVANAIVLEVTTGNSLTGIAVSNLFIWNSILLQLEDTETTACTSQQSDPKKTLLFVEYVHIQSSYVRPGDRVTAGQVLGTSGSVGFSPEPHLHFAAYRSAEPHAPTVRVSLLTKILNEHDSAVPLIPMAGFYYVGEQNIETNNSCLLQLVHEKK